MFHIYIYNLDRCDPLVRLVTPFVSFMAWAIRAAVCSMRLDVLSPLLYCRVPARLLRRRSMEDQRRRHQLPDVTAHLSQLLSKACCQRIIHNLGRWLIQWVFPRWLGSESKAMRSCSMVLKPSLMTRLSTFFPKKNEAFPFPLGFFLVQSGICFCRACWP